MADFNVRSDSVNVEQIMEQIRARIREKRGVDYTDQQVRELAAVKLERFLDPRGVRSDLLDQFKRLQPAAYTPPELPRYTFEDQTLYESHRPPLRWIRRLLRPVLKLFFNPNPLIQALHIQAQLNAMNAERERQRETTRHELQLLEFELLHNLVVETTRLGIEVKNLKMRVESLTARLEFNERRARALEGVVMYKPPEVDRVEPGAPTAAATVATPTPEGPGQRSRRRRRRRGRRSGPPAATLMGGASQGETPASRGVETAREVTGHRDTAEPETEAPAEVEATEPYGEAAPPSARPSADSDGSDDEQ